MTENIAVYKDITYMISKSSRIISQYEIETLLAYLFNCTRRELYAKWPAVDDITENLFDSLVCRRLAGEPVQYIVGNAEFNGLDLIVEKGIFIPRPETETLIDAVLSLPITHHNSPKILDLCTGSGNIAISLAKLIPRANIVATDVSDRALAIAKKNAARHNVAEKIEFHNGDLFQILAFDKMFKFDIITCNPPYIKTRDIGLLQREIRHEPEIALDGGCDGLEFYRRIASQATLYLKKGGSLFLEIGFNQLKDIEKIFCRERSYSIKAVKKDFSGIERVVWIGLL